jgi:hypothetical protein
MSNYHAVQQLRTDLESLEPKVLANLAVCFQAYAPGLGVLPIFLLVGLFLPLVYLEARVGQTVS